MKERLSSILGENVVKYMWVGTFHSICGRILRQDIENYQFPSGKKNLIKTSLFMMKQTHLQLLSKLLKIKLR